MDRRMRFGTTPKYLFVSPFKQPLFPLSIYKLLASWVVQGQRLEPFPLNWPWPQAIVPVVQQGQYTHLIYTDIKNLLLEKSHSRSFIYTWKGADNAQTPDPFVCPTAYNFLWIGTSVWGAESTSHAWARMFIYLFSLQCYYRPVCMKNYSLQYYSLHEKSWFRYENCNKITNVFFFFPSPSFTWTWLSESMALSVNLRWKCCHKPQCLHAGIFPPLCSQHVVAQYRSHL